MSSNSFVSYLRCSTTKQEVSGLGIEAQRAAVARFVGDRHIVREFVEIESGAKNDRPHLIAALALAKKTKSTLVIAKVDRLGRNVALVSGLMESGVDFVCCDAPPRIEADPPHPGGDGRTRTGDDKPTDQSRDASEEGSW